MTTYRKSLVDLADLPTYYGGRKSEGLVAVGDIEHGLGNSTGEFAAGSVDVTFTDVVDRFFRSLLATSDLEGCELRVFAASPDGRKAAAAPHVLYRGVTEKPQTNVPLQGKLSAVDSLFADGGPFGPDRVWPPLIPAMSAWVNTPPDSLQETLPWLYGEKTDEGATDPTTNAPASKGLCPLIYVGQESLSGGSTSISTPLDVKVPTSPGQFGGNAGTLTTQFVWSYVTVIRNGVEGLLSPEAGNSLSSYDPTPHGMAITWEQAPNSLPTDTYRVYCLVGNWGTDSENVNPLTGKRWPWDPLSGVAGQDPPPGLQAIRVFTHDNVTQDSAPYPGPFRIDITSLTDGVDGTAGSPYPNTVTTTTSGSVTWDAYVVFGHPVHAITGVYGSDLGNGDPTAPHERIKLDPNNRGDILVPGYKWPFTPKYREYIGPDGITYWLTMIYATGPLSDDHKNGVVTMAVNSRGREDVGDGTGLPYIHAHYAQHAWLENEILSYWTSGALSNGTTFPKWADGTPKVRSSAFIARQQYTINALGAIGLKVGWYVGKQQNTLNYVNEWNYSTETVVGDNGFGQITLGYIDETRDPTTFTKIDHVTDIYGPVQGIYSDQKENWVIGACDYDPDADKWRFPTIQEQSSAGYAANKNRWKKSQVLNSNIISDGLQYIWVLKQRLKRLQYGETVIQVPGGIGFLDIDVDSPGVNLTTFEGQGAAGYVNQPMQLRRRHLALGSRVCTLTLVDLSKVLNTSLYPGASPAVATASNTMVATDGSSAPVATL